MSSSFVAQQATNALLSSTSKSALDSIFFLNNTAASDDADSWAIGSVVLTFVVLIVVVLFKTFKPENDELNLPLSVRYFNLFFKFNKPLYIFPIIFIYFSFIMYIITLIYHLVTKPESYKDSDRNKFVELRKTRTILVFTPLYLLIIALAIAIIVFIIVIAILFLSR